MAQLYVVSSRELAGKTAIAVGLARGIASHGKVLLARAGSGPAADADAVTFAGCLFASSPGRSVALEAVPQADAGTVVIETDAGVVPGGNASVVLVIRGEPTEADMALVGGLAERLVGTIVTNLPLSRVEDVARDVTNAGLRPLAIIPEDSALASPSVGEIRAILGAEVLYEGDNDLVVVEDVLLSPVYADPARPHFRRFDSKAILAPFNKTDLHLAAIETQAACLVITGGHAPSPYVVDRAQGEATTVLLTQAETPETLTALSDVWLTSRFRGDHKSDAIFRHIEGHIDLPGLLRKLL